MTVKKRRKARELALQALYALELSGNPIHQIVDDILLPTLEEERIRTFAVDLFEKSAEHKDEIDRLIKKRALNWEFDRIAILDKLIMRMAICEFLYFEDIPPKVSMDEAIEIAKKYSTERSGKFINGILDAVLLDVRKLGRLKKRGRGLLGE